jgi:phospholipase/carboxylesterase
MPSRREFLATSATVGLFAAAPALWWQYGRKLPGAKLSSRPKQRSKSIASGTHPLGLSNGERDGLLYVPKSFDASKPAPLILALHGATQSARFLVDRVSPLADALGCAMLAPDSRAMTWDGIQGTFATDIAFIDRALEWTFERVDIDAKRIWLAGFSDGASYGLSLAVANGDLFSRILAFSPGFMPGVERAGPKPRIFVSHGTNDQILPIQATSRVLVPELKRDGYGVRYEEFEGRHGVPPEILTLAAGWLKTP